LVVEDASEVVAVGEDVGLVGEVGTARVDQVNATIQRTLLAGCSLDPIRG
jgi:hypothetical protein